MDYGDIRSQTLKSDVIKAFLEQNNVRVFQDLCELRAKVSAASPSDT